MNVSKKTLFRAGVAGVGFAILGAGMTAPAYASGNIDGVQYSGIILGKASLQIFGGAGANMTVTEALDGNSVTITDTTASGFSVQSPCQQIAADTVNCPISNGNGLTVIATEIESVGGFLSRHTNPGCSGKSQ